MKNFIFLIGILMGVFFFVSCNGNWSDNDHTFTNDVKYLKPENNNVPQPDNSPLKSGGYFDNNQNSNGLNKTPNEVYEDGQKKGYEQAQKDRASGIPSGSSSGKDGLSGNYYDAKYNSGYQEGYAAGSRDD